MQKKEFSIEDIDAAITGFKEQYNDLNKENKHKILVVICSVMMDLGLTGNLQNQGVPGIAIQGMLDARSDDDHKQQMETAEAALERMSDIFKISLDEIS